MKNLIAGCLLGATLLVSQGASAVCDITFKAERYFTNGPFSQIMGRSDDVDADNQIVLWFANTFDESFERAWSAAAASGARLRVHEEGTECGGLSQGKFRFIGTIERDTGDFTIINP